MFFLNSDGQSGTIAKGAVKRYRLKYEITNCTKANITFDLYAGGIVIVILHKDILKHVMIIR